jgi:hypothetical protein
MDSLPQLSPKQSEALDVLVDLFRQSQKGNSEARSTFLGIAIYLARTNVLELFGGCSVEADSSTEYPADTITSVQRYGI